MLSEDMCQRNHNTGLKMITQGGQHQKVFNIFGNKKPKKKDIEGWKYKHPFEDIFWGGNIYLSGSRARACNVPHQVYAKGLCHLLVTLQKCCPNQMLQEDGSRLMSRILEVQIIS